MSKVTVVLIGAGLLLVSAAAAAETYRWVDTDGKVHYSDRPVQGAQEIRVRVPGEEPAPPADANDSGTAAGSEVPADADDPAQVRAQLCEQARERLAAYEKADGITTNDGSGGQRLLSTEERIDTIVKARRDVRELCEPPA
ncbi:MAG TPA: DUF4124 domain-containing protein [Nevskiales bacterium]|nr:DUF4124 domain-containing protein [Nevskiales bacterium]